MTTNDPIADTMKTAKEGIRHFLTMELTKPDIREGQAPLFLISHGSSFHKYLIYNVFQNRFCHLKIPDLIGKKVIVTDYGWFVLVEPNSRECCLFNPTSMDKIQLPMLKDLYLYNKCVLSKSPAEPDCHILFIDTFNLCYCQIGDQEFTIVKYGYLGSIASFLGQVYFFKDEDIQTIHFVGKNVELTPMHIEMMDGAEFSNILTCHTFHTWLIESPSSSEYGHEAELLMVQKMLLSSGIDNRIDFRVFRIDTNRRSCIELVNIDKRTIFLSNYGGSACCCWPTTGIKPNSIYYTNGNRDKNYHVFDLINRGVISQPFPPRCVCPNSFTSWVPINNFISIDNTEHVYFC